MFKKEMAAEVAAQNKYTTNIIGVWGFLTAGTLCIIGGLAALVIGFVAAAVCGVHLLLLQKEFAERRLTIVFRHEVLNMYAYSLAPDDDSVYKRNQMALNKLQETGNRQGLKVYAIVFRNPVMWVSEINDDGTIVTKSLERPETTMVPAGESFEQFSQWVEYFITLDTNKRKIELAAAGIDWNMRYTYGQEAQA
jgi:hypothetical protein